MANAIYPKWKEAIIQASSNSALTGTVKLSLIDTGTYTYSSAHQFYSDLSGVVATSSAVTTKTYTNGTFDFDDVTWSSVSGSSAEAIVAWIDTGVAGTSRLICFIDTGQTGLPVTPNGGNITLTVNASGFFTL